MRDLGIYLFIAVYLLATTQRPIGITLADSSGDRPVDSENSSSILPWPCNFTNSVEFVDSQNCLCTTDTSLWNSTDTANECRCAFTSSTCGGSNRKQCLDCLCGGGESFRCMVVNSSANCESESRNVRRSLWPVNVLLLVPFPDAVHKPAFDRGHAIIPAVRLAAEQINRRSDILSHFSINVQERDSGCDKLSKTAIEVVKIIRDLLVTRSGPVGVIGPACSEESLFVNTFFSSRFTTVPIPVFYIGTSPYLSENANETLNAFGMIGSARLSIRALVRIAEKEQWKWKNIAILYDGSRSFFQQIYGTFIKQFNNSQQLGYTRQISESRIPLTDILRTAADIRIVVVFSGKKPARQLACLAGQSTVDFVFPTRQFIFIERSLEDFLDDKNAEPSFIELLEGKKYYCNKETVMRGLNGSVLLNQALDSVDPDVVTVSNYTAGQVKEQYKERLLQYSIAHNSIFQQSIYAYPYYDAMWALAYGWHDAIYTRNLNTFTAVNNAILNNVSFQGVSSWIEFRTSGDQQVSNPVRISQVDQSNATTITLYNKSNLTYPADVFISDEFVAVNVLLHPFLVTIGFTSAFLLLVFTAVVHVMNVVYRNHPSVKASSQRLNHFIFIGCYLHVVTMISYTIQRIVPEATELIFCNMDAFCSVLGYCFIISTVLAKSWRTYRIFNHPFERMRFLKDSSLGLFIMGCVLVSMLLFIPLFILNPFRKSITFAFDNSQWPPVRKQTIVCDNNEYISIPLTFQLFLTAATISLATLNKSIKYSNFRNTKQIFVFVYLLAVTWAVGGSLLVILYRLRFSPDSVYPLRIALLVVTVVLSLTILQLSAYYVQVSDTTLTGKIGPPAFLSRLGSSIRQSSTHIMIKVAS